MKSLAGLRNPSQRRSRWTRLIAAVGSLMFGVSAAMAQNIAVTTLAGTPLSTGTTDGTGSAARFNIPKGVVADASGNLYVADANNHTIRKIVINTGVVTTLAGTAGVAGGTDATGTAASFRAPQGLAISGTNLFVADTLNHTIRKIDLSTGAVTTVAGTAQTSGTTDATGAAARFNAPIGLVAVGANLYVADQGNNSIRQVVIATGATTTFAGVSGTGTAGQTDGTGAAASFDRPGGIAADALNLYVADTYNHTIRKIVIGTAAVTTIAGTADSSGSTDDTGAAARFNLPGGIAVDAAGANIYVADTINNTVRRIVAVSGAVTTVAGSAGFLGNTDGIGTVARFQNPYGVAVDGAGAVYVADAQNHTIRRATAAVAPSVSNPSNQSVALNGTTAFTVTGGGNPTPTIQWQRQAASTVGFTDLVASGTYVGVTSSTLTIVGATAAMNGDQFRAVASNGAGAAATSAAATLTVTQPPVFTSAASTSFTISTAGTFTVAASGSPSPTFSVVSGSFPSWASFNSTTGVISGTPTDTLGSPFTFVIRATNTGGTTDQSFTLTVVSGPSITTQPVAQIVGPGQNAQFFAVAAANGGGTLTYQWQYQAAGTVGFITLVDSSVYLGTNTATLTIVAPNQGMSGNQYRVVASTGVGTPATSTAATLTVTQPPTITSLSSASFVEGTSGSFQVLAIGSPSTMTYSLTSGSLPSGLSLNPATGVISGIPAAGTSATSPYLVQVAASNGVNPAATQNLTITVSATALVPTFTTQPTSVTVALGQTATFTAVVTGNPTPTLQWERLAVGSGVFLPITNDATFSGANTATLTITNPTSGMSGDVFRLVATNSSGAIPSSTVTLTLVVGTTISTYAGLAQVPGSLDGAVAVARFNGPSNIALDAAGNLYIADSSNHVIRKISTSGAVTTLAGLAGVNGSADGTGGAARFNAPAGVAVTSLGTVYVADTYNHTIRMVTPDGVVTTIAGLAGSTGSADGTGNAARFLYPYGIVVDAAGTATVADTFNHTIRKVTSGGVVTTFAGTAGARGTANANGTSARFAYPFALAQDSGGNLYVADSFNHAIRKIDLAANVTAMAGNPGIAGSTDGLGTSGLFNQPSGIAVDSSGNVYVADTYSNTIRKVTPGGVVTTLAGLAGSAGTSDGVGSAARFSQPFGIAVDSAGNLFIADTRNHTIRRSGNVSAPTITTQPVAAVAVAGGTATFTVAASGAPTPTIFTWMRQPAGTTGFSALTADSTYSGVNSATLTVTGVTDAMNGDQFQVVVSNLISPNATSNAVTLTTGTAPVFTSAASATFQATNAGTFTVTATGTPTPTFSATGLPSWATLDASTGVISGTPPDTSGSPFTVTVRASNGIATNQTLTITVLPAVLPPAITTQPSNVAADQGSTAVFSVTASGTAPLSYQWARNGASIAGATGSNLSLGNVQASAAGSYTVTVSNAAGSVTSTSATLVVNTAPIVTTPPRAQTALAGETVRLSVSASGGASFTYQWRKNGVPIVGANGATLTLTGVTAADTGNYDVLVSNALGTVTSSLAQLNVVASPTAPTITAQPGNRVIVVGGSVTLSVGATGAPTPSYQWRRNGVAISGANNPAFAVTGVAPGDAGTYDVVVSNSAGSVTSAGATVRVLARSFAGTYFGSFAGGVGTFALYIRDDNTGVFLGYVPGSSAPVMSLAVTVNDAGGFSFSQTAIAASSAASPNADEPARAAALGVVVVNGTIGTDGNITGAVSGGVNASLSATRAFDTGATQNVAGFYQAGASNSGAVSYTIAGPNSQAFAVVVSGNTSDGGTGSVTTAGAVNVNTNRSIISTTITPATGTVTGTSTGAVAATFAGASEAVLARQRLVNISTRARVASGDSVAIAGFVISGEESKPVLIRAVGPTLAAAPFNLAGALTSPRLELFRGQTSLAVNTGIAANRLAIDAAGQQAGAFALGSSGADAAILTTLAPGAYTAVVSSTSNTAGVALIEVYDLSSAAAGQKLLNIATRASAGTNENTLIAGFVVPPGAAKRVLVRGVGPGLTPFGVSGVVAQPTLQLLSGSTTVAQNTNWTTSTDRDAISTSSAQVGAFGMANNDSALIATLAPGNYTAIVTGAGGATGVALIEVYELP
ncbi:MAG: immunoglobulin domain-containing protein [Verrucomicrobia bacterium]|nr:immunoglobulin domain-containing protein [Verrucomicrobiota bacterium]